MPLLTASRFIDDKCTLRHGGTPIVPACLCPPPHTGPSFDHHTCPDMTGSAQDSEFRAPSRLTANAAKPLSAPIVITSACVRGGFNWSSQHLQPGGVYGTTCGMDET